MTIEEKPYLKEINKLYKKILDFETAVHLKHTYGPLEKTYNHYINDDRDTIIKEFSKGFDLSSKELNALKDIVQSGAIDFMILRDDEKARAEEEFPLLFILSRPFYRSMRNQTNMDNIFWQEGRCAVCGAVPSLSILEKDTIRRYSCSFCRSVGQYNRIGCPDCRNDNAEKIKIMYPEEGTNTRVDTCDVCKSYVKTFQ
ncbi:formate dehydrogenase accessory protein FdhE, partial [bacterium]